jgi:hypothetical protein
MEENTMNTKITDSEIDLYAVRDQFVAKVHKLNRLISDYDARTNEAIINAANTDDPQAKERFEIEVTKNRDASRQLRRLRDDTDADINAIVTDLNRLARERKSA